MLVVVDGAYTSNAGHRAEWLPIDAAATAAPGKVEALPRDGWPDTGEDTNSAQENDTASPVMSWREFADTVASFFMVLFVCLLISLALTPMLTFYLDRRAVTRDPEWMAASPLAETMMCNSDAVCVDREAINLVIVYLYLASLLGVVLGTMPMWYLM